MQKCIIGKKIGMTQIFDETGKVIPVTVVEAGPCAVSYTHLDVYKRQYLCWKDVLLQAVWDCVFM